MLPGGLKPLHCYFILKLGLIAPFLFAVNKSAIYYLKFTMDRPHGIVYIVLPGPLLQEARVSVPAVSISFSPQCCQIPRLRQI